MASKTLFTPTNCKCTLAYTGTNYYGFQKSEAGPSIEEALQNALEICLQHPVRLQAASRTDRGVHAEEQVINFFTEEKTDLHKLYASLRNLLPKDIAPLKLIRARGSFHPTLDAKGKEYHYWICNHPTQLPFHAPFSWHFYYPLNLEHMQKAANLLIGKKDFSTLSNLTYDNPIRTLTRCEIFQENGRLRIEIEGDNFLYKMVRNIAGLLAHIGSGKIPLSDLPAILSAKDRRLAGVTAPAHGLILKRVFY